MRAFLLAPSSGTAKQMTPRRLKQRKVRSSPENHRLLQANQELMAL